MCVPLWGSDSVCALCREELDKWSDLALVCACGGDRVGQHSTLLFGMLFSRPLLRLRVWILSWKHPRSLACEVSRGSRCEPDLPDPDTRHLLRPADVWLPHAPSGGLEAWDFAVTSGLKSGAFSDRLLKCGNGSSVRRIRFPFPAVLEAVGAVGHPPSARSWLGGEALQVCSSSLRGSQTLDRAARLTCPPNGNRSVEFPNCRNLAPLKMESPSFLSSQSEPSQAVLACSCRGGAGSGGCSLFVVRVVAGLSASCSVSCRSPCVWLCFATVGMVSPFGLLPWSHPAVFFQQVCQ